MIPEIDYVVIENVSPEVDGGIYYVKRSVGDVFTVEADIFSHGHEVIRADLLYRVKGKSKWNEVEMELFDNDRWRGSFDLKENSFYEYTIFAYRDPFLSWMHDTILKFEAGLEILTELIEGKAFVENAIKVSKKEDLKGLNKINKEFDAKIAFSSKSNKKYTKASGIDTIIFGKDCIALMKKYPEKSIFGKYNKILEVFANRKIAEFAAWYEMWPRSQGKKENESATFKDMEERLPEIQKLGFHVVYLTPIHPVGKTNRKGPNNSLDCPKGSPGCPYAIGNEKGGHKEIEPSLGSMEEFVLFEKACRKHGMEIALDFAVQASPDHPWVKKHPEWFNKRHDGTIKFAENPPKKYEDIYPINFDTEDKEGLWNELLGIVKFWMGKGVRIFRVDNPHTKPLLFWKWLISEIHKTDPDVIFLSEAFTRPKIMKALAKVGFTQSYTYFTWRDHKHEFIEYFTELTNTDVADYMWGNLFTNTPDILPKSLQNAPPASFKIRAALAATLSSIWGIYNGFELCEGTPLPGKEEYLNSEKYQYKVWDWDRLGNIKYFVEKLNKIRNSEPALQKYSNLLFHGADNDRLLFFSKHTLDFKNIILIVINLDPYHTQESFVYVPTHQFSIPNEYEVHDLVSGKKFKWHGDKNFVSLNPNEEPVHIFKVIKK